MSLDNLKQVDILKAEITFLFALWDKINPEQQNKADINLTYKNLESLKTIFENKKINLLLQNLDLWEDLLENWRSWRQNNKPIQKIYGHAESLNSGIDKGSPKESIKVEPQENRWISNAFGSYKDKIVYLRKNESEINSEIENIKTNLENFLNNNSPTYQDIKDLRKLVEKFFLGLLSDDRYPINDITLWEQSYMPVCMFKALLSNYLLNNTNFDNINNLNPKWRILAIQYDKLGLMQKSLKLASIEWYRDISQKIDNEIQKLIEFEIPLGNEIYRDNSGIYFLVGEDITTNLIENKIYEIFETKLENELYPYIKLTTQSRGIMGLGTLLEEAKKNFLKAKRQNTPQLNINNAVGICPICQMRFISKDDIKKKNSPPICKECDKRIHHYQVKEWKKEKETIWIDEISYKNRVALVSLKFNIDEWLNGDLLNTLLTNLSSNVIWKSIQFFKAIKNIDKVLDEIVTLSKTFINSNIQKYGFLNSFLNELGERKLNIKNSFYKFINETIVVYISNDIVLNSNANKIKKFANDLKDDIHSNTKNVLKRNLHWVDNSEINFKNNLIRLIEYIDNFFIFLEDFLLVYSQDSIKGHVKGESSFHNYIKQIIFSSIIGTKWENWIKTTSLDSKIDWEYEKIKWNELEEQDIDLLSKLLLQFLLRKNSSPARLRRVWETTQEFFEKIEENILDDLKIPKWKRNRLVFNCDSSIDKDKEFKNGVLQFWAQKNEKKVYLITSIEEFLLKFGNEEIKKFIKKKEDVKLNEILNSNNLKEYLIKDNLEIEEYFEQNDREKETITLNLKNFEIQPYKPYVSITKPSPKGWQFIIPIKNITNFIDKIKSRYDREFKYVYGKLPLHIGIVVQKSKDPFYVGLKALRNMQDYDKNFSPILPSKFCLEYNKKISLENNLERINNPKDYYSLYWNSSSNESYQFFINSKEEIKKLSTLDKFDSNDSLYFIPNTIDFEFLDTNTRRNDIYYNEEGKRVINLKQNRPYSWEEFEKFKNFRDKFKDKSNELQILVSLIYSKMKDWQDNEESFKIFLDSTFKQRGLNKEDFGMSDFSFKETKKFLDMFEFWHTALKEI